MLRPIVLLALALALAPGFARAADGRWLQAQIPQAQADAAQQREQREKRRDRNREAGESSSKDTIIDLSPPPDDALHPGAVTSDVEEFHAYDPHRAEKNTEVGDFYMKRGNYRAAISRYREALEFKPNDAIATFQLAVALEKVGEFDDARKSYDSYLKMLPKGPSAAAARKALQRLTQKSEAVTPATTPKAAPR